MAGKSGIQKARYPRKDVPALTIFPDDSIGHYVRYRIVSEDRGSASHWSPTYAVPVDPFTLMGSVSISYNANSVTAVWGDALDRPRYDVYVMWGADLASASSSGTTRTVTTTLATHGFSVGDSITITNFSSVYNGTYVITGKTANTFSFTGVGSYTESVSAPALAAVFYSNYSYHGTPAVHTYSFLRLAGFDMLHVDIQVESIQKVYNTDLLIYDSPEPNGYTLT